MTRRAFIDCKEHGRVPAYRSVSRGRRIRVCRPCSILNAKTWQLTNRERKRTYDKAYRAAHRDEINASRRAWREKNKGWVNAAQRARYERDPEYYRSRQRARYAAA